MDKLNLNEINVISDGIISKREILGNDMFAAVYQGAILINLALLDPKNFPKKQPKFRIRPKTQEEKEKELMSSILALGLSLTAEAERPDTDNVAYNDKQAKEMYEKAVAKDIGAIDA